MNEDPLQRQLRFSDALNRLGEVTLGAVERGPVLEAMARIAGSALRADRALVYDIRRDEGIAVGLAEWLSQRDPPVTPTIGTYPLQLFGGALDELWTGRTWLESSSGAPRRSLGEAAIGLLHGQMQIQALLWFPFAFRERGFHLLAFNQLTLRPWRETDVDFIGAVARHVSLALNKLDLVEGLAASEGRYRALYDDTPSMFFTVTAEGMVASLNRFAMEHLGYPEEELIGRAVLGVFVEEDRESVARQLAECFAHQGQVFRWEARKVRKDGTVLSVREIARSSLGLNGRVEALIVCDDITEQKRTEQAMLNAQKLETLGVLVGGISHDFNNLLGTIVGNAELGLLRLPSDSPAREPIQLAARAALRAGELVRQLLTYSAQAPFTSQRVDVNEVMGELVNLLVVTVGKRAKVELVLDPVPPTVLIDPTQLRQVLMNLVHNAADAMAGREGTVRVTTSAVVLEDGRVPPLPAGRYVRIQVIDSGVGIEPAALGKIFDPFFTTKVAGRGLGLSAVQTIAQRHGGRVLVESTPGLGSTFTVVLPAAPATVEGPLKAENGAAATLEPGATVLVVDDDTALLGVLVGIIREFGLIPLAANGVAAGRDLFSGHPEIACVLLDLTMPEGGGAPLARAFHALRPTTPIILMSGFAESEVTEALGKQLAEFLPKPFSPAELKAALGRAMQPR